VDLLTWISALILAAAAGFLDWRSRRIPNWLTVAGFVSGLALHTITHGWDGTKLSLEGAGLALVFLLPLVLLKGLGAGDWKLMGGLGAFLGPIEIVVVLFSSILLCGILAVAQMVWQRRVAQTLANLWQLIRGFFILGIRPNPEISLDNPAAMKLPFGVVAAAGTFLCFWLVHWGV
jgi:prepilin peptidase CpaA